MGILYRGRRYIVYMTDFFNVHENNSGTQKSTKVYSAVAREQPTNLRYKHLRNQMTYNLTRGNDNQS